MLKANSMWSNVPYILLCWTQQRVSFITIYCMTCFECILDILIVAVGEGCNIGKSKKMFLMQTDTAIFHVKISGVKRWLQLFVPERQVPSTSGFASWTDLTYLNITSHLPKTDSTLHSGFLPLVVLSSIPPSMEKLDVPKTSCLWHSVSPAMEIRKYDGRTYGRTSDMGLPTGAYTCMSKKACWSNVVNADKGGDQVSKVYERPSTTTTTPPTFF